MISNTEYEIYIVCKDAQILETIVSEEELREMVAAYFAKHEIGFSMISMLGGYLRSTGDFVISDTLCINIIGEQGLDIVSLAKNLSMYMNQECSLVVKHPLVTEYR